MPLLNHIKQTGVLDMKLSIVNSFKSFPLYGRFLTNKLTLLLVVHLNYVFFSDVCAVINTLKIMCDFGIIFCKFSSIIITHVVCQSKGIKTILLDDYATSMTSHSCLSLGEKIHLHMQYI